MIELEVADELVDHEEARQLLHIDVSRDVLPLVQSSHEAVETVAHDVERQARVIYAELGFLDVDGQVVGRGAELLSGGLVVVGVELEQRRRRLVGKVHAVVREAHLLRQVVAAAVGSVEINVHGHYVVGGRSAHEVGGLHAYGVRHQRARLIVGEQHPALAGRHAQRLLLLGELQAVRFLGPPPAAVAAPLDLHGRLLHRGEYAMAVDAYGGVLEVVLASDGLPVGGGDVNRRHLSAVREPINVHAHQAPVGLHGITTVGRGQQYGGSRARERIIYVVVEAQAARLALLQLAAHIHQRALRHLERGRQALAYGGDGHVDGVAHDLAQGVGEELVVELIVELERLELWEVRRRLLAHARHVGEGVGERLADVRSHHQLPARLRVLRNVFEGVGLHAPVVEIDVQRRGELRHRRGVHGIGAGVGTGPRVGLCAFLGEVVALVGRARAAGVGAQHALAGAQVPVVGVVGHAANAQRAVVVLLHGPELAGRLGLGGQRQPFVVLVLAPVGPH